MADLSDLIGSGRAGGTSKNAPLKKGGFAGMTNKDLMADAREALSGNWGIAILGYLLYAILIGSFYLFIGISGFAVGITSGIIGADPEAAMLPVQLFANGVSLLITGPLVVGICGFFLGIAQEREEGASLEELFVGFRRFGKSFVVYFFTCLFIYLWSLLFIIPGIIAAFRYSMAFFVVADDPECGPFEAIRRSKEMMKGNKWKFFCLHWRFLGWAILSSLTFGIGYIWLIPYMQTSFAKFYEDVK